MDRVSPFELSVDLAVVEHLGEQLYSNVGAVLTEVVANAWDADATEVRIELHRDAGGNVERVLVRDDGVGMSAEDLNRRYLRVAYRKRQEEGETTPKGRKIMGRKGIGKLALLAIAGRVRVETRKKGEDLLALEIVLDDLKRAIASNGRYHPPAVEPRHADLVGEHGTVIELSEIRRERFGPISSASLRRRLARRFSVIGREDFRVFVDDEEVTPADRDDLRFAQFLWLFKGTDLDYESRCPNLQEAPRSVPSRADDWEEGWTVRGWIATVDKPRSLATPEGNLNSVVVMARGRLVLEDVLPRISGAQLFTKYVTGQIEADFLDDSSRDDIVTSDRQRVLEDDERVVKLVEHLKSVMAKVESQWSDLRQKKKRQELFDRFPGIKEWLNELKDEPRKKAQRLLDRVYSEYSDDEDDDRLVELLRAVLYGFERLRLREVDLDELERALEAGVEPLLRLLSDRDALEGALYRDIVRNRLEVIQTLERLTSDDQKEKIIRDYLKEHLWLLDPGWDRATEDPIVEKGFRKKFKENGDELYGRVDILFRMVSGTHLLVELKRYSVRPQALDLYDQVKKYLTLLQSEFPHEPFQVVVVLGPVNKEVVNEAEELMQTLPRTLKMNVKARVLTYDELILNATKQYNEYLERSRALDKLDRILTPAGDAEES